MITAYAQNFEDVLLWRALSGVEKGRYVDVGAHDPDYSSVTRLFYEHGWRGINIEPVPEMFAKLVARRPEDRNIQALAGDAAGSAAFFEVRSSGLSTMDPAHAQELRDQGWTVVEHDMPVVTLDSVLEDEPQGPLHFLKVDVEGAEATVLGGLDLAKWRPWILVIEATAPQSQTVTDSQWADMVLRHGYRKVYFDALNDYFVAEEHPELAEAFGLQPNVFDDFIMAADHSMVDQNPRAAAEQRAAELAGQLNAVQAAYEREHVLLAQLEHWAKASEECARTAERQLAVERERMVALEAEAAEARSEAARAFAEVADLRRSTSWRVTAPLRVTTTVARSAVKNVARPVLDKGLEVVRGNAKLRSGLRGLLRRVPGAEARLQGYANARPVIRNEESE